MTYDVAFTLTARKMLSDISDRRVREKIRQRIDDLAEEPEKQGKPLSGELTGYRSVRAVGQRFRIIYRVEEGRLVVIVIGVGIRREGSRSDVYALAKKLVRLHLIEGM